MPSRGYISRTLENCIFDENLIARHMVFLAGPRQVGKTELAKRRLNSCHCQALYFNWDDIKTRQAFRENSRFFESPARMTGIDDPWIVFDEIHKRPQWRDILKGVYDVFKDDFRFLVTGSARLDLFRRSGDALVGRYNLFHMMPFNVREALGLELTEALWMTLKDEDRCHKFEAVVVKTPANLTRDAYRNLYRFGPFPEPYLKQNDRFSRKWHQDYISLVIRQELRDISRVVELDKIESLLFLLAPRLMSPLSMANLARDLEVAHTTVKSWLLQLQRLYLLFPVPPWSKKISRGIRKERKWYFTDWYYAPEGAARLENMTATMLYRACLTMSDLGYGDFRLYFVRTLDKKEIDFVVTRDNTPILAVEVKGGKTDYSRALRSRHQWFDEGKTIGIQVIGKPNILEKHTDHDWLISADRFLTTLP